MATGVLTRLAHIHHVQVVPFLKLLVEFVDGHLGERRYREACLMPGVHAATEIALHVLDTDTCQPRHSFLHLRLVVGYDDDGRLERDQTASPRGKGPAEAN